MFRLKFEKPSSGEIRIPNKIIDTVNISTVRTDINEEIQRSLPDRLSFGRPTLISPNGGSFLVGRNTLRDKVI